jgi:hypothetical protein
LGLRRDTAYLARVERHTPAILGVVVVDLEQIAAADLWQKIGPAAFVDCTEKPLCPVAASLVAVLHGVTVDAEADLGDVISDRRDHDRTASIAASSPEHRMPPGIAISCSEVSPVKWLVTVLRKSDGARFAITVPPRPWSEIVVMRIR